MSANPRIEQFLDLSRLGESGRVYAIGPFFSNGVTLLKQQVRALNLVHALAGSEESPLTVKTRVAVIGGGVAGLTAAAAAVYLGCEIALFEQRPVLCHLQHGCDTRYVHPNIYDWPNSDSDNPYADLPLLSWRAGTAAEVTRQIVNGFDELVKDAEKLNKFSRHLGATTRIADGGHVRWDNARGERRGGQEKFDLIILATGFGVELGVGEGAAQSYWRNDDINQPTPGITSERRQLYLISGTGDGGLVDLLRCRIRGFNQGWLLDDLIPSDDSDLIDSLKRIATAWKDFGSSTRRKQKRWLFNQYQSLSEKGILAHLRKNLDRELRRDTTAILNGRATTFAEALRLDSASLLNTVLTFLLYELEGFSYVHGICRASATDDEATIEQDPLKQMERPHYIKYKFDRLIIRHGTDLRKPLQMLGVTNLKIDDLEQRQRPEDRYGNTDPLWDAGWWSDERRKRLEPSEKVKSRVEFVPHATVALATTFVATLAAVLVEPLNRGSAGRRSEVTTDEPRQGVKPEWEFRATMHRLLEKRRQILFQQISYYEGHGSRLKGLPARVFDVQSGLVGLACRLGVPVLLNRRKKDNPRWVELWNRLHVGEDIQTPAQDVMSMLACPLFAASDHIGDPAEVKHVSMVLFMDSQKAEFFKSLKVRGIVFAACVGFIRTLNVLGTREIEHKKVVRFPSSDFQGYSVSAVPAPDDLAILDEYGDLVTRVTEEESSSLVAAEARLRARSSLDIWI